MILHEAKINFTLLVIDWYMWFNFICLFLWTSLVHLHQTYNWSYWIVVEFMVSMVQISWTTWSELWWASIWGRTTITWTRICFIKAPYLRSYYFKLRVSSHWWDDYIRTHYCETYTYACTHAHKHTCMLANLYCTQKLSYLYTLLQVIAPSS